MKVTHIIDSGGYYGAEVMLVNLCQAQQKAGLKVEVISIGTRGEYKKPLEKKLEEHGIPFTPWRMLALPDLRESFKILKHCQQQGTDVIHSHGYKGNILLGLIPKRWRKIPVVTTIHGYIRQSGFNKMAINQWLDRLCLPKLDAVVLVSEGMRHQVPEKKIGEKLYIIPNGIPENAQGNPLETASLFDESDYKIIAIGRLSFEKNFQLAINTMKLLVKEIPNSKLIIYGEGSEREELQKLIGKLKLEGSVFLPGYMDNPVDVYRTANVFLNCSLTEGMPITILEALREGCAIVASNIPANREILLQCGDNTKLCNLLPEDFTKALTELQFSSQSKSSNLKSYFKLNYTSDISEKRYFSLYSSNVKPHRREKHEGA